MSFAGPALGEGAAETAIDLGQVALALSFAQTPDDVLDVVSDVARPLTGADGLLLTLVRGSEVLLARHRGYSEELVDRLSRTPLDAHSPLAETAAGASAA